MTFARGAAVTLLFCAAACGKSDPVAKGADNTAGLPAPAPADSSTSDPSGAAPPANSPTPAAPGDGARVSTAAIPAFLHGRWGLAPGDCTSTRGDAKGLMIVSASEVRFYESRAVPVGNVTTTGDSFSGDFSFSGEGMNWKRFETFEIRGKELVRTESQPMASFAYARCS